MYESMASQREIYASYRSKICMPHISSLQRLFSFMGTFFVAKDRIDNSPAAAGSNVAVAELLQFFDERKWCHIVFFLKCPVKIRKVFEADRQGDIQDGGVALLE